ncbi:MAG TPA: hypothetical protein VK474_06875 [Chthoniobacterales bacterium]|nr:hypothetical protein [Chthoniobacterales bacterium]
MHRTSRFTAALAASALMAAALISTAKASPKDREQDKLYQALSEGLQPPSDDVLKQIKLTGAQVSPLQAGGPLVRVDFLTGVSKCHDRHVAALAPLKENIAQLDLARTSVTDEALKTAATFPRLTQLDLRKTRITDQGLEALSASKHLDSINLLGTEISDAGLDSLGQIKSLRTVYLVETRVTDAGVAKLKKALPQAEVVSKIKMPPPKPPDGEPGVKTRRPEAVGERR